MYNRRSPLKPILIAAACVAVLGLLVVVASLAVRGGPGGAELEQKMALARKLMQQDEPDKALALLEELRADTRRGMLDDTGEYLRLMALEELDEHTRVSEAAAEFLQAFSDSPRSDAVRAIQLAAEVASAGLSKPGLLASVQEFLRDHPQHPEAGRLELALARHELSMGDERGARQRLASLEGSGYADEELLRAARALLGQLNVAAILRGDSDALPTEVVSVQRGDSVWEIAKRHRITPELLMAANNIDDPRRLRVGQTLRVPLTDFSLRADISANSMTLYNYGEFVKEYPVRTGREAGTTPTGTFRILNKKTNPTWRPGNGYVYTAGDPNNELGTRWMAFEGDILGIHGTIHPETVGQYASNGCIGMTREDVEELFDLVMVGTELVIVGEQDLARHRVVPARDVPPPRGDRVASR